jgi:hypothetical protein
VRTAEEATADLNSVADYPAFAMLANRRERLDRTFEAVECVSRARYNQIKTLVLVVATNFAFCHKQLLKV